MVGRDAAVLGSALAGATLACLLNGCALVIATVGSIDAGRTAPMGGLVPLNRRVAVDGAIGSGRLRLSLEDAFLPRLGCGYDVTGELEVVVLPRTAVLLDASTSHIAPAVRAYLPLLERRGLRIWVSPHLGYQWHRKTLSFAEDSPYYSETWTNSNEIHDGETGLQVGIGFRHNVAGAISYDVQLGSMRASASCQAAYEESRDPDPDCVAAARSVTDAPNHFVTQYLTFSVRAGKPIGFAGFVSVILDHQAFTKPEPPAGYLRWHLLTGIGVEWLWDTSKPRP